MVCAWKVVSLLEVPNKGTSAKWMAKTILSTSASISLNCLSPATSHRLTENATQELTEAMTAYYPGHRHQQPVQKSGSESEFQSRQTQNPVPAHLLLSHVSSGRLTPLSLQAACVLNHTQLEKCSGDYKVFSMGLAQCEVGNSITGQCETNSLEQSSLNELSIMKEMLYIHFPTWYFLGKKKHNSSYMFFLYSYLHYSHAYYTSYSKCMWFSLRASNARQELGEPQCNSGSGHRVR